MLNSILLGLAALGLVAPAGDQARLGLELNPGQHQVNKRYYDSHVEYKRFPRCKRWEVAVRHPYNHRRFICIDRAHFYNDYQRWYTSRPRQASDFHTVGLVGSLPTAGTSYLSFAAGLP